MTKASEINEAPEAVEMDVVKEHMNYDLIDREVAEYANATIVEIDEATNRRLKRLIDKRVMVVMVITYLIQTLDKGTMSYASIMGIQEDTHLVGQQVSCIVETSFWTYNNLLQLIVLVDDNNSIHDHFGGGIPGIDTSFNV
jgi:hypothetical protein